jgi:3-(methylthio)propanoyl-CoA dehydrogenase
MVSVMTCGGLMARQGKAAASDSAFDKAKRVTVRYYLDHLVPEALGKAAAATAGAGILYELSAEELAA